MALYTVEQVELIRRLKLTGITAKQINDAFGDLDRIEREYAPFQNALPQSTQSTIPSIFRSPPFLGSRPPPPSITNRIISPPAAAAAAAAAVAAAANRKNLPVARTLGTFPSPYDSLLNRFQQRNGPPATHSTPNQSSINHASKRKRSSISIQRKSVPIPAPAVPDPTPSPRPNSQENLNGRNRENSTPNRPQNETSPNVGGNQQLRTSSPSHQMQAVLNDSIGTKTGKDTIATPNGGGNLARVKMDNAVGGSLTKSMGIDYNTLIDEETLQAFMSRGDLATIREIKDFVGNRQIRQHLIAFMTGISQPYISRFLSGSQKDLSARVKRVMCHWYLAVKANPDLVTSAIETQTKEEANSTPIQALLGQNVQSAPNLSSMSVSTPSATNSPAKESELAGIGLRKRSSVGHYSLINVTPNGFRMATPKDNSNIRRERFVFKPTHVRILHKYFALDPYPNVSKREEIAAACNKAYATLEGVKSVPLRDRVNSQVVGNWFSNRRKEKRREGEIKQRMKMRTFGFGNGFRSGASTENRLDLDLSGPSAAEILALATNDFNTQLAGLRRSRSPGPDVDMGLDQDSAMDVNFGMRMDPTDALENGYKQDLENITNELNSVNDDDDDEFLHFPNACDGQEEKFH